MRSGVWGHFGSGGWALSVAAEATPTRSAPRSFASCLTCAASTDRIIIRHESKPAGRNPIVPNALIILGRAAVLSATPAAAADRVKIGCIAQVAGPMGVIREHGAVAF